MDYFSKELTQEQITYLNTINNISSERVDLFKEFSISLTYLIIDTYLGDDTIDNQNALLSHFNWCWTNNINNFAKENIYLQSKGEHYYYFLNYFTDIFYDNPKKTDTLNAKLITSWEDTMTMDIPKTKSDYDLFCEIFKTIDKYFLKNH